MTSSLPHVVVVTPYYNRQDYVVDSVQSLVDQTYPNLTIVVMDDGSTDGTWAAMQHFADTPRVKLIRQENQGLSAALNNAIRAHPCDFVAIHGSGDYSHPTRIEKQVEFLTKNPGIVVVSCLFDNDESHNSKFHRQMSDLHPDFFTQLTRADKLGHGSIMFRRDVFDKTGGYRDFYKYAQDYDLKFRFAEHGGYAFIPEVLYVRRKLGNSVNADFHKTLLQEYYIDLCMQAAIMRKQGLPDPVDRYGAPAAFLRKPSYFLGRRLSASGLRWRVMHKPEAGLHYIEAAKYEKLTLRSRLLVALGSLPEDSFAWRKIVRPLLRLVYDRVGERRSRGEAQARARAATGN